MAKKAGEIADGLISTSPDRSLTKSFKEAAGRDDLPLYCQPLHAMPKTRRRQKIAYKQWPITGIPGNLTRELATPKLFEEASTLVTEEQATEHVACGTSEATLGSNQNYLDAGFKRRHTQHWTQPRSFL